MKRKESIKLKSEWEERFLEKIKVCHKKNLKKVVARILKRISTAKYSLDARSRKYNVECNITIEDLRQKVYDVYGERCRYCNKIISVNTFVFDHIVPISKQGSSNADNIQVICKTSNVMKGSLSEEHFNVLLKWLNTVDEELKKDISIRLSRGLH